MMNWIVSSTVLIVVIIALRFLLKGKMSLRLQYALWAIVMIRLLIPVFFGETAISVGNWVKQFSPKEEVNEVYEFAQDDLPEMSHQQANQEGVKQYESQGMNVEVIPENEFVETIEDEIQHTMTREFSFAEIAKGVWVAGSIIVGLWFLFTNFRFQKKLLRTRKEFRMNTEMLAADTEKFLEECKKEWNVYLCDEVETPCLFGLIHPAIYVTSEVVKDEEVLRHVIAHETTHYLHRDYIWGYLRALCLTIHWYNPLVWYAAFLSRNDAELACDEATIMRLGEMERTSYGRTLIGLTCEKPTEALLAATTMTGNKKSIKERIYMIAKKPKPKRYIGILVAFVAILCVGCTFTGADTENSEKEEQFSTESNNTENDAIKTEDFSIDSNIELPAGLSEEEQEKLKAEMEHRKEEAIQIIELQREEAEKQVEFYQNKENGTVVTDEEIIGQILHLLQDEHNFEYKLSCEPGFDGTQEKAKVNGQTVFLIEEATSWDYYENLARKYYSDEYIESHFTPFYLGTVYMEEDGKLYRAFSDGVGTTLIGSTIKVWQGKNGKFYVSINKDSVGGGEHPTGYMIGLSENSNYEFEILDKVILLDDNTIE